MSKRVLGSSWDRYAIINIGYFIIGLSSSRKATTTGTTEMSSTSNQEQQQHRCAGQLSCCCGPKACRFCCQICPATQESTSTKFIYSLLLVLASICMGSLLIPSVQKQLQDMFRDFNATCIDLKIGNNCMKMTGYIAIYKVSFSMTLFFATMFCITIGVTTSKGIRACIHNGFWLLKILIIAVVIVATFVIPISHLNQLHSGWIYTTLVGNCLFIILQMVCLIDSTGSICKNLDKIASRSRWWAFVEAFLAIFVLSLWLTMAIVIFVTHGRQEYCLTKHLVIIFNTGFCITLILAALTPCARRPGNGVDRGRYGGRLLQAGCVVVYVTYWTWSAMQSSPERPGIVEMSTFLMDEDDLTCQVHDTSLAEDGLLGAASLMMFITVAYIGSDLSGVRGRGGFSLSLIKSHHNNSLPVSIPASQNAIQNEAEQPQPRFCVCLQQMPEPTLSPDWFDMQPTRELSGGQSIIRNELWQTSYSYPFFHLSMALGTCFITTQLTRWFAPIEYQIIDFDKSWATVALKLVCSWGCGLIYLLFLLLPDRCCCPLFSSLMNPDPPVPTSTNSGEMLRNGRGYCYSSGGSHLDNENGEMRSDGTFMTTASTLLDRVDLVTQQPTSTVAVAQQPRRSLSASNASSSLHQNFSHM